MVDLVSLAKLLVEMNGAGSYLVREFPPERHAIDIGNYYSDFSRFALSWAGSRDERCATPFSARSLSTANP